jgi:hypothetical protein
MSDDVLTELREQTRWLRFLGLQQIRPLLVQLLRDEKERRAYDLTDGARTTRDIGDVVGVSGPTISRWWSRWTALGIATADERGTTRHMIRLDDLGLDFRDLDNSRSKST